MLTGQIAVSVDVSDLGAGVSDGTLIAWCAKNRYVFVTKDWRTSYEPYITAQLKGLGVSAAWIRHSKGANLASLDLLYVAARDLRKMIEALHVSSEPLYYECRLGVSARLIKVPTPRPTRGGSKRPKRR